VAVTFYSTYREYRRLLAAAESGQSELVEAKVERLEGWLGNEGTFDVSDRSRRRPEVPAFQVPIPWRVRPVTAPEEL